MSAPTLVNSFTGGWLDAGETETVTLKINWLPFDQGTVKIYGADGTPTGGLGPDPSNPPDQPPIATLHSGDTYSVTRRVWVDLLEGQQLQQYDSGSGHLTVQRVRH